ncbi:MAG: choice-of-anchor D domain-containing protein [Candidatus Kapaibacterium sp.]
MRRKTTIFMLLAAFIMSATTLFAESPRLVLVEEFTNASCGPCANVNPAFQDYLLENLDNVVPVIFRTSFPDSDVIYSANPTMYNSRTSYYGVTGVPNARVNGTFSENPGHLNDVKTEINTYAGTTSPITITIDETRDGMNMDFTVTVASDDALNGVRLRVAIVEFYHYYEDAGSNGEKDFYFIAREMLPSPTGQLLSIAAGSESSFDYGYTINSDWNADGMFIAAWVQDDSDKEVLQAGTTLETIRAQLDYETTFLTIPASETTTETFTVTNPTDEEMTVALSLNEDKSAKPEDFMVDLSETEVTLTPGETKSINVSITPGQQAGFVALVINAVPTDVSQIPIAQEISIYALTDNTENVIYTGSNNAIGFEYNAFTEIGSYAQKTAILPIHSGVMTAYPSSGFERAIFSVDFNSRGLIGASVSSMNQYVMSAISSMLNAGKKVLVCAEVEYAQLSGQYPSALGKSFYEGTLMIQSSGEPIRRFTTNSNNQITGFTEFNCKGVNGHEIGDDLNFDMNKYNPSTHPYYVFYTEIFEKMSGSPAEKFLYFDNDQTHGGGYNVVRGDGKLVYLAFPFKAIPSADDREQLMGRIWQWLDKVIVEDGPSLYLSTLNLDFGEVNVNTTTEETFKIENRGNQELVITKLDFFWNDDEVFAFVDKPNLPLRIDAEGSYDITVSFTPTEAKTYDTPGIEVESNDEDAGIQSIMLNGVGTQPGTGPSISTVADIDFGKVTVGENSPKIIVIENDGDENLVINDIYIHNDETGVFKVQIQGNHEFPIVLEPLDAINVIVTFTPAEVETYDQAVLRILSNDSDETTFDIPLAGNGGANSVEDGVASIDGLEMTAGPNPFVSNTTIRYAISQPQNIEITIVDALGNVVANLASGYHSNGEYTADFDAAKLASGTYYVIARSGDRTARLPIALVR